MSENERNPKHVQHYPDTCYQLKLINSGPIKSRRRVGGGGGWEGVGGVSQQLPDFYVLLIKPLLIASRTPFITKIYLTLIQCPPTYIYEEFPIFPPNPHFQRWNIPPPWMGRGKRGVVAFSSGEGTVDWVRIQRLVKGCPTATNTTVALQLHWNQFLASITLLLACWTFHIGCQLKNTFHYNALQCIM